ncbi:hypothetical protein K1719_020261 [Acacia pycnantha]|nr:hypothetical protein K1719_020261 [Acacia pycnantha]
MMGLITCITVMEAIAYSCSTLLKDVHMGILSSGVAGGAISLVQSSNEYHHYLQDGFNDSVISILLPSNDLSMPKLHVYLL